ncbi:MAG: pectate lyase [Chitinispirillia bacterium]|jgi:pectate lyase
MKKKTLITKAILLILQVFAIQIFAAQPIGYASLNAFGQNGTTGGEGGPVVTVNNAKDLLENISKEGPRIILVSGMINVPGGMHEVSSDKTIAGIGSDAGISGGGFNVGLPIDNSIKSPPPNAVHNIIIQNLTFHKASEDNINVMMFSHHIWIHHNTFKSTADGALDIKRGSSYATVSYNHFIGLHKTALIGHNDGSAAQAQDIGRLLVTYHHNFFERCQSRQPRVRFGEVHIYNNYYRDINGYGIGVGAGAKAYSENNYKEGGGAFCKVMGTASGGLKDVGSIGGASIKPERVTWNPKDKYEYKLDPAKDVKSIVSANAGVGKIKLETARISSAQMSKKNRNQFLHLPSGKVNIYNFRGQRIPELKANHTSGIYLRDYNSNLRPYMHLP